MSSKFQNSCSYRHSKELRKFNCENENFQSDKGPNESQRQKFVKIFTSPKQLLPGLIIQISTKQVRIPTGNDKL